MIDLWPSLKQLSANFSPWSDEFGSTPLWSLLYLLFLFMNWADQPPHVWLPATLISIVVFLPLYFRAYRQCGRKLLVHAAAIVAIGFALTPFNTGANTYLIYAAVFLPFAAITLRTTILLIAAGLALYTLELLLLGLPLRYTMLTVAITAIVSIAISAANHFHREKRLRQAELKLSHDEVRRLAGLAERERIGRDLHDLLGHTLSLITLKSELALKLFDRDPPAARREMAEVERVARDALGQVRRAVSGIRAAGIAAELASARLLLESGDVRLDYRKDDVVLPADIETVLALVLREAVTNIQRHARAAHARVELKAIDGSVCLAIEDDGRGGTIEPGNGLTGMHERLHGLGGRLEISAVRGGGTRLLARIPLPPVAQSDASAALGVALA
ncbi:MAG TPA: sensor histidine kinase [Dokdonella sp.]